MKSFVLLFSTIVSLAYSSNAQDYAKEGNIEIGGSIAFTSTTAVVNGNEEGPSTNQFALYLPLNYYVVDRLTIGFITSFEMHTQSESSIIGIAFGIGTGYNFVGESNLIPYIEGRLFYNAIMQGIKNSDVTSSGLGWTLLAGLKVQVTEHVLINTGLGYSQRTLEDKDYDGDRLGSNTISLSSGFLFYF